MEEVWKSIEDYPNYEVSSLGRVKSLNYMNTGKVRELTFNKKRNGYLQVAISKNGITKHKAIHRLVAEAFIPNPDNLPQVNHKDEDKTNNCVSNLEWCTAKYNVHYSKIWEKSIPNAIKSNSKPVLQFTKDGRFVAEYPSMVEAGKQTEIHKNYISKCCRGILKYAGKFIWRYKEED